MNNEIFAKIVGTKNYTITINGYPKVLTNTNELLGVLNGVYGIKTGFTNGANRCLVTCCKRGNMDIICVVLGADTKKYRTTDSVKLIEYTFNNFTYVNIEEILSNYFEIWKREKFHTITIAKGVSNHLDITFEELPYSSIPIRNDLIDKLHVYINYESNLNAPIIKGTSIGTMTLELEGTTIYYSNIFINTDIERKNVFDYLYYFYQNFSNIFNSILEMER